MYLVVFRSRKRADLDAAAYAVDADEMKALALAQPGLLAVKTYANEDGETVSLSEWADEAAAREWGRHAEHAFMQRRGKERYYASYTIFSCADPRIREFGTML